MSGIDEQKKLPYCPECCREPRYYTVGGILSGRRSQPLFWLNSGEHYVERGLRIEPVIGKRVLDAALDVSLIFDYVYCSECLKTYHKDDYPTLIKNIVGYYKREMVK